MYTYMDMERRAHRGVRGRRLRRAALALALAAISAAGAAEAPHLVAAPAKARTKIIAAAFRYRGAPYVYGGTDSSGFDCSGFVFRVFKDALDLALPRSAKDQYAYCEPIGRTALQPGDLVFFDTTGGISHVGIYTGDGNFIHSPSEGSETGVTESSLEESYWSRTFVKAGRVIPPADSLGIVMTASIGPSFGAYDLIRGARGSLGAAYPVLGLEVGLELRPSWDSSLGVLRVPAVLAIDIDRRLKAYAGPALTIGSPSLGDRAYLPSGGFLATAGIEYTFHRFRLAGLSFGLSAELEYDRYLPGPDEPNSVGLDAEMRLRAGLGLSVRWGV